MEESTRPSRRNVIWVFGDQHRGQMLARHGDPNAITPNIDNLAEYGVDCLNAVSTEPLCCPARGTLLTGRYSHHCVPGHNFGLPPGQETIADVLNAAGYETAYFGKWHLAGRQVRMPDGSHEKVVAQPASGTPAGQEFRETMREIAREQRGGFSTWIGYENNNSPHNTWVQGHRDETEIPLQRLSGFETDALTDLLIDYVRGKAEEAPEDARPFFAALSVQPPHDPYSAPPEFMGNYNPASIELRPNVARVPRIEEQARRELAGAYAMVENLDWNLGRIREALVETGLDSDTEILFFSDHGDLHGSQGQFRKTSPFAESLNIPLIFGGGLDVQGPTVRQRNQLPIGLVDLAPTTLGLCGVAVPDWMQGTDYSWLKRRRVSEPDSIPDSAYAQIVVPTLHGDSVDKAWRCLVTRDGWKYACFEEMEWLLFNLNEDPYEMANLVHNAKYAAERRRLNDRLREWIDVTGDAFPMPDF